MIFYIRALSFSILVFSGSFMLNAQTMIVDQLAFYADVMINASDASHRLYANEQFKNQLESVLDQKDSFGNSLESVPWIFVRYAPSKKFRFISWQVEIKDNQFQYFTYFQSNTGEITKLNDSVEDINLRDTYSVDNGYTSIVHQIIPMSDYYLLASYRQNSDGVAQKICEVLVVQEEKPVFGKSLFYENNDIPDGRGKKRVIMNYSPVAAASMNINTNPEENVIVYDHIISVPGKTAQEGMIQVPDGSYEAYVQNDTHKWLYNPNLYEGLEYNPKSQPMPDARKRSSPKPKRPR